VPERHRTARNGRWRRAPGHELFRTLQRELGDLPLVAEDLGVITPAVYALRDELGLPGMVVLHWAFGGGPGNIHHPRNHRESHVVYTGTHDTDTTAGWWQAMTRRQRAATGLDAGEPHWALIGLAMESRASLAIVPAQDVLGLGSEARMNRPGESFGNWRWRLGHGQLTEGLARRLRDVTRAGGRDPRAPGTPARAGGARSAEASSSSPTATSAARRARSNE
jgi:4-alpha-glucanotransferase